MTCYEPQLTTFWSFLDNFGIELDRGRILDRPSLTKNDQESEKNVFSTTKNHSEPLLTAVEPHQRQIKYQSRTNRNYSWRKNCPYYRENYSILREIQK